MAGVVKKGYLDVKTKGKIGSTYKRKYVVLRRNKEEGTKVVEISETENSDENDIDMIPLNASWSVMDKASQNKKRFAFELLVGSNVIMTFSCPSLSEREAWTESFHILNKVPSYAPPLNAPDMYPVVLERTLSATETGISGPCLLRIQDGSIVLYSECGRNKLYQWASENVKNLTLSREQLYLEAYKPTDECLMEFVFNTEVNTGRQILTSWNMALMELVDPQKLNVISNILSKQGSGGKEDKGGNKSNSLSKNFFGSLKHKGQSSTKDEKVVRRAKSFSDKAGLDVRMSPDPLGVGGANRLSVASQESYTINSVPQQGSDDEHRLSPPPVPPRAPRRPRSLNADAIDSARLDPDYSYIKDDHKQPTRLSVMDGRRSRDGSRHSVDKELDDLERDIDEDNYQRKRRVTMGHTAIHHHTNRKATSMYEPDRSKTLAPSMRYSGSFAHQKKDFIMPKEASDYLEPVPSQRVQEQERAQKSPPGGRVGGDIDEVDALLQGLPEVPPVTRSLGPLTIQKAKDHDYSIIPDKIPSASSIAPPPVHFRTTSADSTQSAPELPPRLRKSHGGGGGGMVLFDDPPSPPSRLMPPVSPVRTASHQINLGGAGKVDEISPYATTRGLKIDAGLTMLPSLEPSPPPLPPRSPVKYPRERTSMPSVGTRCTTCNGVRPKQGVMKTQSLADSQTQMSSYSAGLRGHTHNYAHETDRGSLPDLCHNASDASLVGSQTSYASQSSDGGCSNNSSRSGLGGFPTEDRSPTRPESLSSDGSTRQQTPNKETFESAIQQLDQVMKGLEEDIDSKTKKQGLHNDIDAALFNTQQIQSDLLQAKENRRTSPVQKTGVNRSMSVAVSPTAAPVAPPTLTSRRSMTTFKSTPSVIGNERRTSPPDVPPRSLVSLNFSSNGTGGLLTETTPTSSLRSRTPPNIATATAINHVPMHRYEKSNTVFIYHMRDQQPVRIAHKSLV